LGGGIENLLTKLWKIGTLTLRPLRNAEKVKETDEEPLVHSSLLNHDMVKYTRLK